MELEFPLEEGNPSLWKLGVGIILDLVGMGSYLVPGAGEVSDSIWSPFAALVMLAFYGRVDLMLFSGLEEALPGTDVIPSFTLAWFYMRFR